MRKKYDLKELVLSPAALYNIIEKATCVMSLDYTGYIVNIFDIRKNTLLLLDLYHNIAFIDTKLRAPLEGT